jgi:hypothetical protein
MATIVRGEGRPIHLGHAAGGFGSPTTGNVAQPTRLRCGINAGHEPVLSQPEIPPLPLSHQQHLTRSRMALCCPKPVIAQGEIEGLRRVDERIRADRACRPCCTRAGQRYNRDLAEAPTLVRELHDFRVEFTAVGTLTFNCPDREALRPALAIRDVSRLWGRAS